MIYIDSISLFLFIFPSYMGAAVLGICAIDVDPGVFATWTPILLTWFNFNPSMDAGIKVKPS